MSSTLTDAGGLAASCIPMLEAEAGELAKAHYGLSGRLVRFATEKDDTFRIETPHGDKFVLKVANPSEDPAEISFQNGMLDHIAGFNPDLPVPRVIRNHDERDQFPHVDRAGQSRQVRLLSYLDGTPLSETTSTPSQREKIGETLGLLRHATAGFSHPADGRELAWDVKHVAKLEHLLTEVDDADQRHKLAEGMQRCAAYSNRVAACRTQVLHNDFSKSNIVVDPDHDAFVTGIIDFGDAVRTAIAIDVSTALLNQLPSYPRTQKARDDLFLEGRSLLRGYLGVADLTHDELALIPHLVLARVVTRALLSIWRAKMFPDNEVYIMRNTEQGWSQLDWFLARSPDELSNTLLEDQT